MSDLTSKLRGEVARWKERAQRWRKLATRIKSRLHQYELAVAGANDGLWHRDFRSGKFWVNSRWRSIIGLKNPKPEITFEEFERRIHPDDLPKVRAAAHEHMDGRTRNYVCDYRIRHEDQTYRPIRARGMVKRNRLGKILAFAGTHTDQSDLTHKDAFIQELIEIAGPALVYLKDDQHRFVIVNDKLAEIYGTNKKDAIGKTDADFCVDAEEREHFWKVDEAVLKSGIPSVVEIERITDVRGNVHYLRTIKVRTFEYSPDRTARLLGFSTDITALVEAQTNLDTLMEFIPRSMTEFIPESIYFKDEKSCFKLVNSGFQQMLNLKSREEAVGRTDLDFFDPEYANECRVEEERILKTGEGFTDRLRLTKTPTGPRWRITSKAPIRAASGKITGVVGISRDVTRLKESEQLLALALNEVPQGIFWKDLELRYRGCNKSFSASHGLKDPTDVVGKTDFDFSTKEFAEFAERFRADDTKVLHTGRSLGPYREQRQMPDGRIIQLETYKLPQKNATGQVIGVLGISTNITDRLDDDYKMLTRSVAHSLKSKVAVLEGLALQLHLKFGASPVLDHLDFAIKFLKRETLIATSFSALERAVQFTRFPVQSVLEELERVIGDPRLNVAPAYPECTVLASRHHFTNAIHELLDNALSRVPTAETGGFVRVFVDYQSDQFRIHVVDNGPGVSAEAFGREFAGYEPSDPSRTGIGLSYVRHVVDLHGARIEQVSPPGTGAHFIMTIPIRGESNGPKSDAP